MTQITQPLRDEHHDLYPHIQQLAAAGDVIGSPDRNKVTEKLDEAVEFLHGHLLPHAQAEDAALYPVVARVLGAPRATDTMKRDHVAVHALIEELAGLVKQYKTGRSGDPLDKDLRRVLYGLNTLVSVHFAKEEEIYLPLLDEALTPEEAAEMFEALEAAAHAAHQAAHA